MLKIVIAGGFGVGKTTLVKAVSEITPLQTEEVLTQASEATDHLAEGQTKSTTTVALDFGRITFAHPRPMVLLLFGTPGQERFLFTWDDLSSGAVGAVILADTRRLSDSFTAVSYFEQRGVPFLIAVNEFDQAHRYTCEEIRRALRLSEAVPVVLCDARVTHSSINVLIALVTHAIARHSAAQGARP
ncbi:GTP-binding protein [Streptomyces rishiriensis]|uniref:GTP-binding protein n=1 Tax=Streptomyces rishiriensis TaxID=68264 RepID=UPI0037B92D62